MYSSQTEPLILNFKQILTAMDQDFELYPNIDLGLAHAHEGLNWARDSVNQAGENLSRARTGLAMRDELSTDPQSLGEVEAIIERSGGLVKYLLNQLTGAISLLEDGEEGM